MRVIGKEAVAGLPAVKDCANDDCPTLYPDEAAGIMYVQGADPADPTTERIVALPLEVFRSIAPRALDRT